MIQSYMSSNEFVDGQSGGLRWRLSPFVVLIDAVSLRTPGQLPNCPHFPGP